MHVYLSSELVANNDNDDNHDLRDSPVELRYDVIKFYIVFIYPHGGACYWLCFYKSIREKNKKQ